MNDYRFLNELGVYGMGFYLTDSENRLKQQGWLDLFSTHMLTSTNIHGDNALILLLRSHINNRNIHIDIWRKSANAILNKKQEKSNPLLINNTLNFLTTKPSIYMNVLWPLIEDKKWFLNYIIKNNTFQRYERLLQTVEIKSAFERLVIAEKINSDSSKTINNQIVVRKI